MFQIRAVNPPHPKKKTKQKQNKAKNTHTQTKNTLKTSSTGVNAKWPPRFPIG